MTHHINDAGQIGPCVASLPENCPFSENHHGTEDALLKIRERQFEREYDMTMTITRKNLTLAQREKLLQNRIDKISYLVSTQAATHTIDEERSFAAKMKSDLLGARKEAANLNLHDTPLWNPYGNTPQAGFTYSPYPEYTATLQVQDFDTQHVAQFLDTHHELLEDENTYVSLWHDETHDTIHLDIRKVTLDAHEARAAAEQYQQASFFDLQTRETVHVV